MHPYTDPIGSDVGPPRVRHQTLWGSFPGSRGFQVRCLLWAFCSSKARRAERLLGKQRAAQKREDEAQKREDETQKLRGELEAAQQKAHTEAQARTLESKRNEDERTEVHAQLLKARQEFQELHKLHKETQQRDAEELKRLRKLRQELREEHDFLLPHSNPAAALRIWAPHQEPCCSRGTC